MVEGVQAQILQALRAGNLSSSEIDERWSSGGSRMTGLLQKGYVERFNYSDYKITEKGRKACPNRNPHIAKIQNLIKETPIMENIDTSKPKTLLMLEYLEKNKNSTMQQMQIGLNIKALGEAFIVDYIKNGYVVVERNDNNKKMYSLVKPVSEFYKGNAKSNATPKAETLAKAIETAPVHPQAEYEIPAFLRKDAEVELTQELQDVAVNTLFENEFCEKVNEDAADSEFVSAFISGVDSSTIRFAFTSDKTLLILDGKNTQELDVVATQKLMDFCENISMSLVV